MKKYVFLLLFVLASFRVSAGYYVIKDGIRYFLEAALKAEVLYDTSYLNLTTASIPSSVYHNGEHYTVTEIRYEAFKDCINLESVTIPNSVTYIGKRAFMNCSSLFSVSLSNSITKIEEWTFNGCRSLTSIIIPNSVTSIGEYAFSRCGFDSVTIPNSISSIGKHAFSYCDNLVYVNIPNSIDFISEGAFSWCTNLNYVTIPNSVTGVHSYAFYQCLMDSVIIPNSVTYIGDYAFITSPLVIKLGNRVEGIGNYAFSDLRAESIIIPQSVRSIGRRAFYSDRNTLKIIFCEPAVPPEISNYSDEGMIFKEDVEDFKIYVPCGSLNAYKNAPGWGIFAKYIQYELSIVKGQPLVPGTGTVSVPGDKCGNVIEAIPAHGYQFIKWIDENTDNPRTIDPDIEAIYTAVFEPISGIEDVTEENHIKVKKEVEDGKLYILLPDGTRYDATGRKIQ